MHFKILRLSYARLTSKTLNHKKGNESDFINHDSAKHRLLLRMLELKTSSSTDTLKYGVEIKAKCIFSCDI